MNNKKVLRTYCLTKKEVNLIAELRKIPYGEVIIRQENGEPERIERVKESIKL